jgi:hypothetical protein
VIQFGVGFVVSIDFLEAFVKTSAKQIVSPLACSESRNDKRVCAGRAVNPRMVLTVDKRGVVVTATPGEITFLSVSCPVIRDPRSKTIG